VLDSYPFLVSQMKRRQLCSFDRKVTQTIWCTYGSDLHFLVWCKVSDHPHVIAFQF